MYVLHIVIKGIEMSNFLVKSNFIKCQSKNKSPVQPLRYWLTQTKVNAMEPQTTISQGRKVIFANLKLNEYIPTYAKTFLMKHQEFLQSTVLQYCHLNLNSKISSFRSIVLSYIILPEYQCDGN